MIFSHVISSLQYLSLQVNFFPWIVCVQWFTLYYQQCITVDKCIFLSLTNWMFCVYGRCCMPIRFICSFHCCRIIYSFPTILCIHNHGAMTWRHHVPYAQKHIFVGEGNDLTNEKNVVPEFSHFIIRWNSIKLIRVGILNIWSASPFGNTQCITIEQVIDENQN